MMILSAMLFFAGVPAPSVPDPGITTFSSRPALRLWMSNDRRFREGEYARVQVDAESDGYLLVLHYDAFGRLQVLFPLDPRDDSRVRAGRRYEIRDDDGRGAFRADGDGTGLIYSAISPDPWRLEEIVFEGRWDGDRLSIDPASERVEDEITGLVQGLSGPGGFDYDIVSYRVYGSSAATTVIYRDYGRGPVYVYDDYLYCNNWYWRFDGCHRYPFDGGWSFRIRFGYPYYHSYYDPFYYDRFSYPYRYRYRDYLPYYPVFPGNPVPRAPRAVLTGRSRSYTVTPPPVRPATTVFGARPFGAVTRPQSAAASPRPVDWRARNNEARPVRSREPSASRARPEAGRSNPPEVRGTVERPRSRDVRPPARAANPASRSDFSSERIRSLGNRGVQGSNPPRAREMRPPARAASPPSREMRPPARVTRPPSREMRPPARVTRPPSREMRPPARAAAPPPRAQASGNRNSGGQVRGSGGGGHSAPRAAPARSRRP